MNPFAPTNGNPLFDSQPDKMKTALTHLGALTWAGDMNVGSGAGNGPEFWNAWESADKYLRSFGVAPAWEYEAEIV